MDSKDRHHRPDTNTPTIRLGSSDDDGIDLPPHLRLEPGDQVGHYHILSLVAEGGFGIVYLAEQHTPVRRRVALKIIKPGMDTVAVITRFEAERQALAILDHPGIATVYDAGATDDGRPFFVMEYVEGEPITDYCDDHRLETTQRLNLMIEVCAAIQHAHMKGIIHRDIKPSNILVSTDDDGHPRPKVIDFGVAKATSMELTERSFFTETGQLIGTPEYMSPEQADLGSADVDTRSDVYSLGMILYELVSGALPFESIKMRQAGFGELCRIIQEDLPPKPSTRLISLGSEASKVATRRKTRPADLATMLKRELDWIPLKALRKDRDERYDSATALADDIRRYIDGNVLIAGPETSAYRIRKFIRRNRSGVLAGAIVFIALLVGLNAALLLLDDAQEAERETRSIMESTERLNVELKSNQLKLTETVAKLKQAEVRERARADELEEALADLQRVRYGSNLLAAETALDAGDPGDARNRLLLAVEGRDHEPPFEWRYLWAQAESSLALLSDPDERPVLAVVAPGGDVVYTCSPQRFACWNTAAEHDTVAPEPLVSIPTPSLDPGDAIYSPNCESVFLGDQGGQRSLVETRTGKILSTLPTVPEGQAQIVFSGDGRRFAHGVDESTVRVQNSRTATTINELVLDTPVEEVVLDRTGSRAAAISTNRVYLVNTADGEMLTAPLSHELVVTAAAFDSPAVHLATTTMDGKVRVWDVLTGDKISTWDAPIRSIETLRFSPDGDLLHVQNHRDDNAILDSRTGEVIAHPSGAWSMTADWTKIASTGDQGILLIHELEGDDPSRQIEVHSPTATAFSPRGDKLVTGDRSGNLVVWDLSESQPSGVRVGHHQSTITEVSFVNGAARILAVSRDGPRLWSTAGHQRLDELDLGSDTPARIVFVPDLPWLIIGTRDGDVLVIDLENGLKLATLTGHDGEIVDLLVSSDGSRLVSTSRDNTLRLWNLHDGQELYSNEYTWWSETPIVLDQATNLLLVPARGNDMELVDSLTGETRATLTGHGSPVLAIDFDSLGTRLATSDGDGIIRIWELETGTLQSRLRRKEEPSAHEGAVTSLKFDGTSTHLLSASADGTIRTWNVENGKELEDRVILVQEPVTAMAMSPDGLQIASGLENGSVRTWLKSSGDRLESLMGNGASVNDLRWSPGGSMLVATGEDGSLRTWDTSNWKLGSDLAGSVANVDTRDINARADRIASVTSGRSIKVHDTRTGEIIYTLRGHKDELTLLVFSPLDTTLVSGDVGGILRFWNTQTHSQSAARQQEHDAARERLEPLVKSWLLDASGSPGMLEETITQETASRPPAEVHAIRNLLLVNQQEHEETAAQ